MTDDLWYNLDMSNILKIFFLAKPLEARSDEIYSVPDNFVEQYCHAKHNTTIIPKEIDSQTIFRLTVPDEMNIYGIAIYDGKQEFCHKIIKVGDGMLGEEGWTFEISLASNLFIDNQESIKKKYKKQLVKEIMNDLEVNNLLKSKSNEEIDLMF